MVVFRIWEVHKRPSAVWLVEEVCAFVSHHNEMVGIGILVKAIERVKRSITGTEQRYFE